MTPCLADDACSADRNDTFCCLYNFSSVLTPGNVLEPLSLKVDTDRKGVAHYSALFDGTMQYTLRPELYPNLTGVSFALFAQFKQTPKNRGDLFFKGNGTTYHYGIYMKGTHEKIVIRYATADGKTAFLNYYLATPVDDDRWHTVLAAFDRKNNVHSVYIDGQAVGNHTLSTEPLEPQDVSSMTDL